MELTLFQWKHRVLTTGKPGKSQKIFIFEVLIFHLGENEDSVTCDISIFALAARKLIAAIIDLLELSFTPVQFPILSILPSYSWFDR